MPVNTVAKLWNSALKNGSSSNMAVNGSVTPVVFSIEPNANTDMEIHSMCLIAEFTGAVAIGNKFIMDTVATLTNGVLLESKLSDNICNFGNLKRTRDLIEISQPQGGLNIISGTTSMIQIFLYLPPFARLCKTGSFSSDDYLKATVRDDLRNIAYLEMFLQGVKI